MTFQLRLTPGASVRFQETASGHRFPKSNFASEGRSYQWIVLLAISAALGLASLTGCGVGDLDTSSSAVTGHLNLKGSAHGGAQPVVGATIQIWAAGTTGYGKGATLLGTDSTVTDGSGNFNITGDYSCTNVNTPVYITATGGNAGSGTNSAIRGVLAIGSCSTLKNATSVWIDEVSTAAAAIALTQYSTTSTSGLTATDTIGAPNTTQAQLGLSNAFATAASMVSLTTGVANATSSIATTLGGASAITVTFEQTKLDAIANLLAACVNTSGPTGNTAGSANANGCDNLFGYTTPSGGTAPTDIFQAAVLLNLNPTLNTTNLYGIIASTPPYQPTLVAAPTDWTYAIGYSAGTSTTQTLIDGVNDLAIDANGNIWLINYDSTYGATESLSEFSPTGNPLLNTLTSSSAGATGMDGASPRNMAIDTAGNVVVGTSSGSGYVYEYFTSGSTASFAVGGQPYGVAVDGNNNIWTTQNSGTGTHGSLVELIGSTSGSNVSGNEAEYNYIAGSSGTNTDTMEYIAIDSNGNPWLADGIGGSLAYKATGTSTSSCTTYPCTAATATYTQVAASSASTPWGLVADSAGGMYVINEGNSTVTHVTSTNTSTVIGSTTSLAGPHKGALDGLGNLWVGNKTVGTVSEFNSSGTVLSPTGTTIGFAHGTLISGSTSLAIDPSGNVWGGNTTTPSSTTAPDSFYEIVGVAAPTVTPLSLAIKNGSIGSRP